jgi:GDP-4-dehydro-6-deoxy-D-mannose reductase
MRVLVTGATGFVGRWLMLELAGAGHDPIGTPPEGELDIRDAEALADYVADIRPDVVAHLAGLAHERDARNEPDLAMSVNEGGTRAVLEAIGALGHEHYRPAVLVTGSAAVYGRPEPQDLPLRESAPLRADTPYARSKLAQERVALERGAALGLLICATRSFNHTGPGQRPDFLAPALARRVLEAGRTGGTVPVGNLDVRRDLGDVRDVARAYRLLLEGLVDGRVPGGSVANVATGRAVSIRDVLDLIGDAAGIRPIPRVDPELVRASEAPEIVGDAALLHRLTGWAPMIPLEQTLADVVASVAAEMDGEAVTRGSTQDRDDG